MTRSCGRRASWKSLERAGVELTRTKMALGMSTKAGGRQTGHGLGAGLEEEARTQPGMALLPGRNFLPWDAPHVACRSILLFSLAQPHSHTVTVLSTTGSSQVRFVPWLLALKMMVATLLVNRAAPQQRQCRISTRFSACLIPLRMSPKSIGRGKLVEVAHCIWIPKDEYEHHLRYSVLEHYFYVGKDGGMLLALGVGSLFNYNQQSNLNHTIDHGQLVIRYRAARPIATNEELTITNGSSSKLWFEDRSVDSLERNRISMVHEYLDVKSGFLGGFQLNNAAR